MVASHNGHSIVASGAQGYLQKYGETWKLLQFHFHTPAEHEYASILPQCCYSSTKAPEPAQCHVAVGARCSRIAQTNAVAAK